MSKIVGIIPCAGHGTRMGMQPHESKEMLIDPNYTGEDPEGNGRLIDYALNLCYKYDIQPVVISRLEKHDLNEKLRNDGVEHIVLKKPGKEWAETVLKSQGLWGEKNILLLPDTRWEPASVIPDIINELNYNEVVAGVHKIDPKESNKWGTVSHNVISEKVSNHQMYAWGILGFHDTTGCSLFSGLTPGQSYENYIGSIGKVHLDKFVDITRSGKLEKY